MCPCFVFAGSPDTLPPAPCVGFGEQFKKAPGTWDCDVCLVQNKPDAPVCVACSSSRPGSKAPSSTLGATMFAQGIFDCLHGYMKVMNWYLNRHFEVC